MGLIDELMGKQEDAPAKMGLPFNISTSLRPVRLSARKESSLEVLVRVKNATDSPVMTSVSAEVPQSLGFDNLGMTKIKEIRIGELPAHKEKTVSFSVCSSSKTAPGTFTVLIVVNHHFRDYSHILNYAKKAVEIRAV